MNDLPLPSHRPARLTILLATLLAAAVLLALATGASPAHAADAPPCEAKLTRVGGKKTLENCGPATLSLTIGGRTYHYRDGYCSDSKSGGDELDLTLGTLVIGAKGNAGKPYFSMLTTGNLGGSVFEADFGGKQVLGDTLIESSGKMTGSFTSAALGGGEEEFSGSWNCHGVIWHGP